MLIGLICSFRLMGVPLWCMQRIYLFVFSLRWDCWFLVCDGIGGKV